MKKVYFFLLLSSYAHSTTFSPAQLASLAEERSPLIRMHIEGKVASTSQVSQSRLFGNPILSLQSGTLKSGSQSGSVMDLTLNQPVPWPGKRFAAINSAKILEKLAEVDLNESKLMIHYSVSLLSIELAVLNELEKHNLERKHRFSVIHRFLTTRPMASPVQLVEKDLIETQIKLVEGQMYDLETKKASIREQLEFLAGEKDPVIKVDWIHIPKPQPKENFAQRLENGSRFLRSERQVELALNKVEEAKYMARPDIMVGVNYRQENVEPVNHFYHANLAVVIPIIDRGQHSEEVARANARREEANKKLTLMDSALSLNRSYQALLAAYRNIELFRIAELKSVEKRFVRAEDAFKKGRIDVNTFLQTDTQIHESIDIAYVSFINYYTALSEINMLIGQKVEM